MKVTGYKLREALRRWQLRRETAAGQFGDTLKAFPGENKLPPQSVANLVTRAEETIAVLQSEQTVYNTRVSVTVNGVRHSLLHAIKLVGAYGRIEKMWRGNIGKKDKYQFYRHDDPNRRKADEIVARPTMTPDEIAKEAANVGTLLAVLREAIAVANATELEHENLDASLFE